MKINGKSISRATLSDLVELTPEDIGKMSKRDTLTLERRLREAVVRRMKSIEKAGMHSFAYERYIGDELPEKATFSDSRQSIQHKVAVYHTFLEAKSSSVSGIRKVWKEQESRIFGRKKGFTSEDQRKRFWSAYNEFIHQNPRFANRYDSTRVQQYLGEMSFWSDHSYTSEDLTSLLDKMDARKARRRGEFNIDIGFNTDF